MSQPPQYGPNQDPRQQQGGPVYPYQYANGAPQGYGSAGQQNPAPQAPQEGSAWTASSEDSFFASLFDLTFTKFVTIGFVRVIYVIGMAFSAVLWLGVVIGGFSDSVGAGIAAVVFGWIPALITLLLMRLGVEFIVATVRTAQNTGAIAAATGARPR